MLAPLLANGDTWFSTPWWISENYFYKRMLELTDGTAGVGPSVDPFAKQKADSLAGAASAFQTACQSGLTETQELAPLVMASLWAISPTSARRALLMPGRGVLWRRHEVGQQHDAVRRHALCAGAHSLPGQGGPHRARQLRLELISDLLLVTAPVWSAPQAAAR